MRFKFPPLKLGSRLALHSAVLLGLLSALVAGLTWKTEDDLVRAREAAVSDRLHRQVVALFDEDMRTLKQRARELADEFAVLPVELGSPDFLRARLASALTGGAATNAWLWEPTQGVVARIGVPGVRSMLGSPTLDTLRRKAQAERSASSLVHDEMRAAQAVIMTVPSHPGVVVGLEAAIDSRLARRLQDRFDAAVVLGLRKGPERTSPLGAAAPHAIVQPLQEALSRAPAETSFRLAVAGGTAAGTTISRGETVRAVALLLPDSVLAKGFLGRLRELVVLGCAAFVLVGVVLAYRHGASLGRVLRAMDEAARGVMDGNPVEPVNTRRRDELGTLAATFNIMGETVRQRIARIRRVAYRDPATGVPTRVMFEERANAVLARSRAKGGTLFVGVVRVEQLKEIADSLGRAAADAVLASFAERFRTVLRGPAVSAVGNEEDDPDIDDSTLLARVGAFEFAVILSEVSEDRARKIGLRLVDMLSRRVRHDGQAIQLKGSVGLASYPDHGSTLADLMHSADIAAGAAVDTLTRVAVFDVAFEHERETQLGMLADLRRALESRQLYLVYQPKISVSNRSAGLSVEALMRWDHPERGSQNPAEFVEFAEKTGFITKLTRFAIDASLRHALDWARRRLPISVAVNVTARDIADPDLPTFIVERLRAYRLPGDCLALEISESVLSQLNPVVARNIELLRRVGVAIGVDNMGGGFGSLDKLRALPVSYLKIDRRRVDRILEDKGSRVVVKAVIDLAHSLGITAVAEGVENAKVFALLKRMGCDEAQGYYFGRPLASEDFEVWVRHQAQKFGIGRPSASTRDAAPVPTAAPDVRARRDAQVVAG
ncbi:MAG: EAL domain-containing protein [Burkholderiaceae bacterium]|nr:EAL domain-containing protein [Burkholderiaceae bacterium]